MNLEIANTLNGFGIPAHILGYRYLGDAIEMYITDPSLFEKITVNIYPAIAKKYNTKSMSVERAIRHANIVATAKKTPEFCSLLQTMGITSIEGIPNKQLITLVGNYFLHYKNKETVTSAN